MSFLTDKHRKLWFSSHLECQNEYESVYLLCRKVWEPFCKNILVWCSLAKLLTCFKLQPKMNHKWGNWILTISKYQSECDKQRPKVHEKNLGHLSIFHDFFLWAGVSKTFDSIKVVYIEPKSGNISHTLVLYACCAPKVVLWTRK